MDEKNDLLKLDNQLCFALYVCSKEIIRLYKPLLSPLGLTYTSYITMMALWEKDRVSVNELGKRLFLDSGTLTPLLKKMEAAGFIRRIRSSEDERTVIISLTSEGRDLRGKCTEIPEKMVCAASVNREKGTCLLTALHQMLESMVNRK
jgi:DNA-binding MarR family transcriptional regulator